MSEQNLRADAPIFVPKQQEEDPLNNTNEDSHHGYYNQEQNHNLGGRRKQGKRRTKTKINDDKNKSNASIRHNNVNSTTRCSSNQLRRENNQKKKKKRYPNSNSKTLTQKKQKDDGLSSGPDKMMGNENLGKSGKSRRRRRQKSNSEKLSSLPLNQENSFPSLVLPSSSTANNTTSQIWVDSFHKPEIFQPLEKGNNDEIDLKDSESEDFARQGLHKLTSRNKSTKKFSILMTSLGNNENNKIENNETDSASINSNEEPDNNGGLHNRTARRAKNWNMNRLRDRWWDALSQRRIRQQLIAELKRIMKDRVVDPHVVTEISSPSDNDDTEDEFLGLVEIKNREDNKPIQCAIQEINLTDGSDRSPLAVLREAIDNNDEAVLKELLLFYRDDQQSKNNTDWRGQYDAFIDQSIYTAVKEDKPRILRVILNNSHNCLDRCRVSKQEGQLVTPLMMAAELGHGGCILLLLSRQDRNSNSILSRDEKSDTFFHYFCRGSGDESTLRSMLKELSSGAKWKQQQLAKLLLTKNNSSKTPLHIACENDRVDFVETFLSMCGTATLSKMLSMTDNQCQTPLLASVAANSKNVVMCLIMWRVNNLSLQKTPSRISNGGETLEQKDAPSCPLAWAAKSGNLEMIHLLLQFIDSSGNDYRVTEALLSLLRSTSTEDIKAEGLQILIQAGANPFLETILPNGVGEPETAISVASKTVSAQCLQIVVDCGRGELSSRQMLRRRDPKLRQQPETFFLTLEAAENQKMDLALTNALFHCLCASCGRYGHNEERLCLPSAVALFKCGSRFEEKDVVRLRQNISAESSVISTATRNCLAISYPPLSIAVNNCFVTSYRHFGAASLDKTLKVNDLDRSILEYNSHLMRKMAWLKEDVEQFGCSCPWLLANLESHLKSENPLVSRDRVILSTLDNKHFVVHGEIVSQKSAKIASAVRFEEMKEISTNSRSISKIQLEIEPRLCKFMLQHIYHGSICSGWSSDNDQNCREILELMMIAEEFLCTSLIQECEMRLLSSDPTNCFCWSCAKAVRNCSVGGVHYAECAYGVEGPSSLITGSSVLDVLAITQYLEPFEMKYGVHKCPSSFLSFKNMATSTIWSNIGKDKWTPQDAVRPLKDVAINTIFCQFPQVLQSSSFQESVFIDDDCTEPHESKASKHAALLLEMSLEELSNSKVSRSSRATEIGIQNTIAFQSK